MILLTDANGITVEYLGNERDDAELRRASLYLGADWNEEHAATCGVGICATELQPVTVHQTDHFDVRNTTLTCTTAPIFDPEGNPLAVLDVSSLRSPRNKASQHLLLELVKLHARRIESAAFIDHFQNDYAIMRIGPLREYVEINSNALIAVDEAGKIVGLTPEARQLLFGPCTYFSDDWSAAIGSNVNTFFDQPVTDALQQRDRDANNLISVSLLHDRGTVFVSITPPRRRPTNKKSSKKTRAVIRPSLALDELVGGDAILKQSIDVAKRLLNNKINFLIEGETGTGKELFARAIHKESNRASKPFVAVNCAAIPESLIESELFGYTPGTFTGARRKGMQGLIQQSNGGTLFLDEIGDMPLNLQTRLLRVLSEHELMPLGSDKAIPLDLNVIAATHKDIEQMIADGDFREDLYFRIAGATLTLPALRDRADKKHVIESALLLESGTSDIALSSDSMALLESYSWPGNIRELRNVLRIACAIRDGNTITLNDFPKTFKRKIASTPCAEKLVTSTTDVPAEISENTTEADSLIVALRRNKWNVTEAAADLGMSRATVYRHMKKFRIVTPNERDSTDDSC